MKKLISLLLCAALLFALAAGAFAAETDTPATNPPATNPPATNPPATNPPVTDPPATNPPATDPPATDPPATDPPVTNPPATDPDPTQPTGCNHSWSDWNGDETTHHRKCTLCGTEVSGAHSWSQSGTVMVEPTCIETGVMAHTCSGCDMLLLVEIPVSDKHSYDSVCDGECNLCGATREAAHKFSEAWTMNYEGHWHACLLCGAKDELRDHYPGPAATEEADQICLTCGYVMTPKLNHKHEYETQWSYDKAGHYYACTGCGEQKDYELHSYDDLCDPDCNVCGYRTETAHSWDEEWFCDETGHRSTCVLCNEEGELQDHVPGEEATEFNAQNCTVCGWELAAQLEHTHDGGDSWEMSEVSHWKTCACGEKLEVAAHDYDTGVVNEDTTVTYACLVCGAEKTEGEPMEEEGFPWLIVLVLMAIAVVSAVVALIFVLKATGKKGKYSD